MRKAITLGLVGWLVAPFVAILHVTHDVAEIVHINALKAELKLKGQL